MGVGAVLVTMLVIMLVTVSVRPAGCPVTVLVTVVVPDPRAVDVLLSVVVTELVDVAMVLVEVDVTVVVTGAAWRAARACGWSSPRLLLVTTGSAVAVVYCVT